MKLIMKYFSYEGRFSRSYAYHIRLLMHFTRVRMMNLPYFMCRNIEKMTTLVQQKTPQQQFNSIYHFSLIKIMVVHHLGLRGKTCTWEKMLEKANKQKNMLRNMAYHYLSRNMVYKARIRILKAKLKKASRKRKEQYRLQILAKASLAHHKT